MAKQHFLNGGYIGKLGNTVGQRWKDKKIVRTYVIPANPNTPAQQTARQQFATANKLAQQAMNINGHTGVWDTSTKPEYSQRVGQAMKRLRLGYSEQDSLPLYPEGQSPAVGLSITDVTYNEVENKYIFQTQGFALNNPLATEITFFTPLNYAADKYQENIIHGTVDSQNGTFTVDLSANNQADTQLSKTLFQDAMRLGFCAMKATFYDALGIEMPNLSISRRFKVTNKLYDFDESLQMLQSNQKVTFTQAFSQNRIEGAISPFQTAGFPIVYKLSVENQYYGGLVAETAESSFITMNANQDATFTVTVTPATGNLQETTATTYGLTVGATQPQITRDTSTEAYPMPIQQLNITDVVFAGNTITFNVDQNLTTLGATGGTATILYKDLTKWPAMDNSTLTAPITIGGNGTSCSITSADVPKLGGIILGQLNLTFTQGGGTPIVGLDPDPTRSVAGKYYYSTLEDRQSITQTTTILSGKSIGGTVKASFKATAYPAGATVYQNAIKTTYKDGQSEVLLVAGIRNAINAETPVQVTTATNANKEIISIEVITLAVRTDTTANNTGWESSVASVTATVTLSNLTYNPDDFMLTFSKAGNQPSYLTRIGGQFKAWETTSAGLREEVMPITAMDGAGRYTFDMSYIGADTVEKGAPVFMAPKFFYEDNTECTTTTLQINRNVTLRKGLVAPYNLYQNKPFNTAAVNTNNPNAVTFAADADVFPAVQTNMLAGMYEYYDDNGDVAFDGANGIVSTSLRTARFSTDTVYISGANIQMGMNEALLFWYISGGNVYLVSQN